jgi:hypothetical protein
MPTNRRERLILVHLVLTLVISFFGTFLVFRWLEPSRFMGILITVGLPVAVTGGMVTLLTQALDDAEE